MLGVACFMLHAACCVLHVVCCMLRVAQELPRARIAVGLGDSTGGLYNLEWINNEYVPPGSMRRLFYVASHLKVRKAKPRFAELRVHVSCLQHCTVAWRYTGYRRILRAPGSSCCAARLCDRGAAAQPQHSALARCCPKALHCAEHCTALRAAARVRVSQTLQLLWANCSTSRRRAHWLQDVPVDGWSVPPWDNTLRAADAIALTFKRPHPHLVRSAQCSTAHPQRCAVRQHSTPAVQRQLRRGRRPIAAVCCMLSIAQYKSSHASTARLCTAEAAPQPHRIALVACAQWHRLRALRRQSTAEYHQRTAPLP